MVATDTCALTLRLAACGRGKQGTLQLRQEDLDEEESSAPESTTTEETTTEAPTTEMPTTEARTESWQSFGLTESE